MPELPDIAVYVERLRAFTVGKKLLASRVVSPFVVRTVDPSVASFTGQTVASIDRIGKRLVFGFADGRYLVIHLMIAGRLRWKKAGVALPPRIALVGFDFGDGTLVLSEASKKRRASLHAVSSRADLALFHRGGISVFDSTAAEFAAKLRSERHTIKRALTDPSLVDGIGNAYSDEILHAAKLSPFVLTTSLSDDQYAALQATCKSVLTTWIDRLREQVGDSFPDEVTAFHAEMAVHGKYNQPCPVCGQKVQRIVYASNEANYCAQCQTGGKLLADRSLSRLLKDDWPKTLEELEERKQSQSR